MTMHQNFGDRWPSDMPDMESTGPCGQSETVIALHCSGADSNQWNKLAAVAGPGFNILAPGLLGATDRPRWTGEHKFSLLDEARPVIVLIDSLPGQVHLVGHSYGGGVALKVASLRPWRIGSIALYEPSAFHLLNQAGGEAQAMLSEIENLASKVGAGLINGAYEEGARAFVDYWNGDGAWASLCTEVRDRLTGWLPNASLHFHALIGDQTPLALYRRVQCPVLLMQGEQAKRPSRTIVRLLHDALPGASRVRVAGAGHMGPVTHVDAVNSLVIQHMASSVDRATVEHLPDVAA